MSNKVEVNGAYLTAIETTTATPTTYSIGEFYTPGFLHALARYSDSSSKMIVEYNYAPSRPLTADDKKLAFTYTENNITVSTSFDIQMGYVLDIEKTDNDLGTCAVEVNSTQYIESNSVFVSPGTSIKFIADEVYINNNFFDGDEYVANSPMTIILDFADDTSTDAKTAIYAYTAFGFVTKPPIMQRINASFDASGRPKALSGFQITHIYDDGTKELVNDYVIFPETMPSVVGPANVTVSYQRAGETYSVNLPIYINGTVGCFEEGTLVTMADGTKKTIEDVTYDDELLAWDFNTGRYAVTKPSLIETDSARKHRVLNLEFDDGTVIGVIDHHGFFDKKENDFVFIDETNVLSYIGHEFIKMSDNGAYKSVKLKSFSIEEKVTRFYTIQTAVYNNCIAEDMFTLTPPPDGYVGWFNYFEIGRNMKYDEFKKRSDIARYGLYSYDEFSEYVTYEQFMAFNGPYLKVLVGKGLLTKEQILNAVSYYLK